MLPADSVQPADGTAQLPATLGDPMRRLLPLPGPSPAGPPRLPVLLARRTQSPPDNPLDRLPSSANLTAGLLDVDPAELLFLALRFLKSGPCGSGEAVQRLVHEAQERGALPSTTDYLGEGAGRKGELPG